MARGYPDFEGNKAGVYLKAEWAAREGLDINVSCAADTIIRGASISEVYPVPVGKVVVLTEVSGSCVSWLAVDGELNQMCIVILSVAGVAKLQVGGNGGAYASLSKPIIATAGQLVGIAIKNMANHDCSLFASVHGYEVDA